MIAISSCSSLVLGILVFKTYHISCIKVDYQETYAKNHGLCRGGRILLLCCLAKGRKKTMTKQASNHVNNVENIAPELKDVRNVKRKE